MGLGHTRVTFRLLSIVALACGMAATGCTPTYNDYEAFYKSPKPIVGGGPYVIEPPDSISIIAPGAPEIDGSGGGVRPDGYITLHLLGDIFAAGKTPTQLAAEIEEKALKYYQDVSVEVQVDGYGSKSYYMSGEFNGGQRSYNGTDTIMDAVLSAGIPRTAWPEKLVVIRPNERGDLIKRMTINVKDMLEKGDLKYNIVIEEGDILFMPIHPFAAVGVAVQNILAPVSPIIQAVSAPASIANSLDDN